MNTVSHLGALCLRIGHVAILLFNVLGWLISQLFWLKIYLIFVPLVVIQWAVNKDRCVLTQLEHRLKGTVSQDENEEGFVESFIQGWCKKNPTKKQLQIGIWGTTLSCWIFGLIHLFLILHGHHIA